MVRHSGRFVAGCLGLVCGMVWAGAVFGQTPPPPAKEPPVAKPAAPVKMERMLYFARNGAVKDLANALTVHYQDDPTVQFAPVAGNNALLIRGSRKSLEELSALLERLDRMPRTVAVDVLIVEIRPRRAPGEKPQPVDDQIKEDDFSGKLEDVLKQIEALKGKGLVSGMKHLQLTAVENEPLRSMLGMSKAYVTGSTLVRAGISQQSISYRDVGTTVNVTTQLQEDTVSLDLQVEESRFYTGEDAVVIGQNEKGDAILAPEFVQTSLRTRVRVPAGSVTLARGVKTLSKSGLERTLIIVGGRPLESSRPE